MSATTPALFAAAAGVGFGHAVLPDHWVPLAVLGRTRRYPLAKIARLSGLAGVAHVLLSIVLGAAIIAIGLQFRSYGRQRAGRDHRRAADRHRSRLRRSSRPPVAAITTITPTTTATTTTTATITPTAATVTGTRIPTRVTGSARLAAIMVPFGAAASPDLTILPVFLAATTAGVATAVGSVVIFGAVTIGTIVGLTLGAAKGGYQIKGDWLDRWGNALTAGVLVVIGALILGGVI